MVRKPICLKDSAKTPTIHTGFVWFNMRLFDLAIFDNKSITLTALIPKDSTAIKGEV